MPVLRIGLLSVPTLREPPLLNLVLRVAFQMWWLIDWWLIDWEIFLCSVGLYLESFMVFERDADNSVKFQSFEVKTEADSNDITECLHDDKPNGSIYFV